MSSTESNSQRLVVVVLVLAVVVAALFYFSPQQPRQVPRVQAQAGCAAGEFYLNCVGDVLVYLRCDGGSIVETRSNCVDFGDDDFQGYCNPSFVTPSGATEAACDYKPKSAAAIAGEVTPVLRSTATATPTVYPQGPTVSPNGVYGSLADLLAVMPRTVYCGNLECDASEDCSNCAKDCGCGPEMFCKEYPESGVHLCELKHYCGDGECDSTERSGKTCCTDCICASGQFCDVGTEKCVKQAALSDSSIEGVVAIYVSNYSSAGEYIGSRDGVYGGVAVKEVYLDCGSEVLPFCRTVLIVAANGTILDVLHSM